MLYCKRKVRILVKKNRCFNKGLGKFFEWDNQSFKGRLKHYVSDGLFHKMISRLRGADMGSAAIQGFLFAHFFQSSQLLGHALFDFG